MSASQDTLTLSLGDIALCVQVIDVCSRRGAIQGNELQLIGALRNRLAAIVDANKPAEEAEAANEAGASSSDAAASSEARPDESGEATESPRSPKKRGKARK